MESLFILLLWYSIVNPRSEYVFSVIESIEILNMYLNKKALLFVKVNKNSNIRAFLTALSPRTKVQY